MPFDLSQLRDPIEKIGIILVDHGSRREESNQLLLKVVKAYQDHSDWQIVEPAHMELAEPSIAAAFQQCVGRGAELVIIFPYFLSPGRHWHSDIPALAAEASRTSGGVRYLVTAPLGLHELMLQVIDQRIANCLQHAGSDGPQCDICTDSPGCALLPKDASGR